MVEIKIKCIHCESEEVVKMGYQKNGTPRCRCKDCGRTFQTKYINNGDKPATKKMIVKMSINGSGIRDTARVLCISKDTDISFKKTKKFLTNVNSKYINLKSSWSYVLKWTKCGAELDHTVMS